MLSSRAWILGDLDILADPEPTLNEAASCDGDSPASPGFAWKCCPAGTDDAELRWDALFPPFPPPIA